MRASFTCGVIPSVVEGSGLGTEIPPLRFAPVGMTGMGVLRSG